MAAMYESTQDLCKRLRCTSRTLFRRMKRQRNPFPAPSMRHAGSCNLWDAAEVAAWEEREREHARMPRPPHQADVAYAMTAGAQT